MRTSIILVLAVTIGFSGACVRKQEKPKTQPPPTQPAPAAKPAPLAEYDLAGRKRAKPRPTMGALEADTAKAPERAPRPPKKPGRASPTEKSE